MFWKMYSERMADRLFRAKRRLKNAAKNWVLPVAAVFVAAAAALIIAEHGRFRIALPTDYVLRRR